MTYAEVCVPCSVETQEIRKPRARHLIRKRRLRMAYLVVWSPQRSAAGGRTLVAARQACDFCPRATEMKPPKPGSGSASASEQSISGPFFRVIEAFVSTAVQGRCSTLNLGDKHSIVKGKQRRGLLCFFCFFFCTWGGVLLSYSKKELCVKAAAIVGSKLG